MAEPLTITQRDTLERIKSIIANHTTRLRESYPDMTMDGKPITPSSWEFLYVLTDTHHLRMGTIKALIRKGYLERRSSDGFGPQVRPNTKL